MEVISCKKGLIFGKTFGFTIKHNQVIGWMGTTGNYIGWYRYKADAIKRMGELKNNLK